MIELKKSELEPTLLTISAYSPFKQGEQQRLVSGLLMEDLTLGTKRKLQKIYKFVQLLYKEFIEDFKKLQEACKIGENEGKPVYDEEKFKKELQELLDEVVKIDVEPIKLSSLEDISTKNNYNFDIIEKFAI